MHDLSIVSELLNYANISPETILLKLLIKEKQALNAAAGMVRGLKSTTGFGKTEPILPERFQ